MLDVCWSTSLVLYLRLSFFFFARSKEVFPAEFGPQYDSDLQTLFEEFLYRLAQLLPVPDLEQVRGVEGFHCSYKKHH